MFYFKLVVFVIGVFVNPGCAGNGGKSASVATVVLVAPMDPEVQEPERNETQRKATPLLEAGIAGLSSAYTFQESLRKLESRCEDIRNVAVVPPSFPLAKNTENHLICHGFSIGSERVESLALTFADDRLVMIFAEGHAAEVFLDFATTPLQQYIQFAVSLNDLLIADRDKDQVLASHRRSGPHQPVRMGKPVHTRF